MSVFVSWSDLPEGLQEIYPPSSVRWVLGKMGLKLTDGGTRPNHPPKSHSRLWCGDCFRFRVKVKTGMFSCPGCGDTEYGYVVGEYQAAVTPKQSEHSRNRWMRRKLTRVVGDKFVDVILADFSAVLHVMIRKGLIKGRNFSGYSYYIIRLCSRRGILLSRGLLKDLKKGKTKDTFDNNLFGVVYKELGWERSPMDKFYTTWLEGLGA